MFTFGFGFWHGVYRLCFRILLLKYSRYRVGSYIQFTIAKL